MRNSYVTTRKLLKLIHKSGIKVLLGSTDYEILISLTIVLDICFF